MSYNSDGNLKKGMMLIFVSNLINMGFKVFINFVQPAFLSLESYAMIQVFNLYVSYIGLLHFGYVDGMYLKYGGQVLEECDQRKINKSISTLRSMQLVVSGVVVIVGFIANDYVLAAVGCSILPANIAAYYRMLYQATGKFKLYGRIINVNTVLLFVYNLFLIFVFHVDNYQFFLACEVIVYSVMCILLEVSYRRRYKVSRYPFLLVDKEELKSNITEGLPLTLGNLAAVLFTSLDRWFVKLLLTTSDFAYYSFAVSIETFMNLAISPVTITLYNFFCNHDEEDKINEIKNLLMVFAVFVVSVSFPAKFILEHFMSKYILSAEILFVLFSTKILSIIIQGVYVNLYKAQKRQREYLIKLIACIFVGALFNVIGYAIFKANISFAIATLATIVVWFLISAHDFRMVHYSGKDTLYILIAIVMLNICGRTFGAITGFCIYIIVMLSCSLLLERKAFGYVLESFVLGVARKFRKS